ncbi:MAG: hypothetical protein H0T89_16195 [Deltaproteobacteria bacterium]|nr:hypothetical protein [Deltaproteobacteria bacterium]MDQ3295263.1 hypothetical protein [Myxococcota bacterium]
MTSYAGSGLFVIAMAAACDWTPTPQYCEGDWAAVPPEAAPPRASARTVAQVLPAESAAVDILFVIDDSMSMADEQAQLGIWSSNLFEVLSGSGDLPDLHIAVTSSSVDIPSLEQCRSGMGGSFQVGGAVLQNGRFIRDVAGLTGRERNYSGTLTETFAKMARVGDSGCGMEQPFKAARLALSNESEGFLRDDALLLVVFVTDEDDCSARDSTLFSDPYADACSELGTITSYRCFEHGVTCYDGKGSRELGERNDCRPAASSPYMESVAGFAEMLKGLKPDPAQVVVAAIHGKPNQVIAIPDERITTHATPRLANVCGIGGKEGSGATPAIRMNALLAEFGGRASQSSICDSELSWAMRDIGRVTRDAASRSHCLAGPLIDADVAAAGIQPGCRVEATSDVGTDLERRVEVPPCDRAGGTRCFTIDRDPACADTETQLAFRVIDASANETLTIACDVENAEVIAE